ncbi:PTS system trehalose-specific EIIBC component [Intestinibaculum porci]|uniref:PTS system trehalose-specific EIIBC component n=1 Tax=Intestinibaculum porci TaxID=2487118 RepID=UPI0024095C61|nr:PTS system trehalose-specific EIIBC component [Intestinibaculum porci]MDD6348656.1 PTS system trehalose-specific EIIBC component [Intestinibaculum porci]
MGKFTKDCEELLKYVGGKENINAVTHCVTRMRFVLADPSKADVDAIEEIPSAKGTFTQSGQFQVIIGNEVSDFYNEFTKISGIEGVSKEAVKSSAKSNQTILQKIMGDLGEIFAPIIPALICGGLILGFRNVIGDIALVNGKTLTQTSTFWMGTYNFLWLIGEAVFHMLPVGICWSVTKKMGTTQILGIVLGLTLVSGQLLNGFAVASTPASKIPFWNFGFAHVKMIGYQGQVIAAIMAAFVLVYLEKFWRKVCPAVVSMIVVPFFSLVPAVILAHTLVGPIGWAIGDAIAKVVYGGLTSTFSVIFAAIFGALYAPIVMTGLHHMTNAIDMTLISKYHGTILWPMIALSNIAQGSAVLGMSVLQKKNDRAQQVNIPALISCYLGVTEPALFGVNLKYGFPLVCGMIGSSIAAIISVASGTMAASIGVGGIPGILSIKPQFWGTFALAMLAAIVVPFLLTLIVGKKKLTAKDLEGKKAKVEHEEFVCPMTGHLSKIEDIDDQAFASKAMGDGIAVELTDGKVYAPFSGEIVMAFPTKHAYGIRSDEGKEVLMHIGMDTVELNGEGFISHVEVGNHVHQGDLIVEVDLDYIKSQGKSLVSPVVFTDFTPISIQKYDVDVKAGEDNILTLEA